MSSLLSSLVRLFVEVDSGGPPPRAVSPPPRMREARLARSMASVLLDVARQDGRIDADELSAAIGLVEAQLGLGEQDHAALEQLFREVAVQAVPLQQACAAIVGALDVDARMELVQGLYALSALDGERTRAERARVRRITELLQLSPSARTTALVRALGSVALCYELLEVSPDTSDTALAEAYQRRSKEVRDPEERAQLRTAWEELRQLRRIQ